jgi:hypothetical protein
VNFLAPLFLLGAAAAAIPIALHLLKRQPEARVKFAVVRMLRQAPVEHTDRRHLRELLLLALRVSALLLLALAFARPFLVSGSALDAASVTLVVLDTSMSLSAPGRFEQARELARQAIRRAPASDLVGLITFADVASTAAAPSADRGLALAAVNAADAGFGATRYRAALNHAAQILNGRGGSIVLVTDLQESGWDAGDRAEVPDSARIEIADVGAAPANLAVVAVRVVKDRIVATVRNAGPEAREARVRLSIDERPAGEGSSTIAPGQTADVALPGGRGATASVSVEDREGVAADNLRYLVIDAASRPSVLVVTADGDSGREAFYVQHALAAEGAGGALYRVASVSPAQLSTWDSAKLGEQAAVLVLSTRGLERSGRERLSEYARQGGGVFVAAGPDVDGEVAADAFGRLFTLADPPASEARPTTGAGRGFAPVDLRHPIFRAFGAGAAALGLATFERIALVRGDSCQTLAQFTTGETALLECTPGTGRALVLASDLNRQWNDFPRHTTFVPFLHEALTYLVGPRPRAAEYLIGQTPPGLAYQPGIVMMPAPGGGSPRRVAVNVDPAEADSGRLTTEAFMTAVTRIQDTVESKRVLDDRQREDRQRIWQYVLGAMLLAMLVESFVASRTA